MDKAHIIDHFRNQLAREVLGQGGSGRETCDLCLWRTVQHPRESWSLSCPVVQFWCTSGRITGKIQDRVGKAKSAKSLI